MAFPERITTERMSGERISAGHFDEVCRLHRDPAVMKTLSADGLPLADDISRQSIERHAAHWEEFGFGLWIFRDCESDRFLGRSGLMRYHIDGKTEYGLAYAVVSTDWNRGLATEMAAATIDSAFQALPCESIASWTLPTNIVSQRVMEKLGFRYERDITFAELPHRLFRLPQTVWNQSSDSSSSSSRPASDVMPQTD